MLVMIELLRQTRTVAHCLSVPLGHGDRGAFPTVGRRPIREAPKFHGSWPVAPHPFACRPGNAALKSLAGSPLAARFHAWHGASGRRYVCSVYPLDPAAPDAGLPEFAQAVVIAVARTANGRRHLVSIGPSDSREDSRARECFVLEALAAGAGEWHVHLLAGEATRRRAALADIAAPNRCGKRA